MVAHTPSLSDCNPPPIPYIDRGRVAVLVWRGGGAHTSSIQFSNSPKIIPILPEYTRTQKMRQQKASA